MAPVNLVYGSHFSATEATYKVSQNMGNFVEFTRTFTRITHKPDKTCLGLNFNENSRNFLPPKINGYMLFFSKI